MILRYGEISLKGKNRSKFEKRLEDVVRTNLKKFVSLKVRRLYDHIEIELNDSPYDQVVSQVKKIFGIQTIGAAIKVENDLDKMKEGALSVLLDEGNDIKTFKISARRKNKKFPIHSNEMNQELGAHLLINTSHVTVDVRNPDVNIRVEVREHDTLIFGRGLKGAGGLPAGSSGKIILMLSGGIDSPVAGYLMQKRGAKIEALHFHSPPYTSERAKQKVIDLSQKLREFGGDLRLHIVPFTKIQTEIREKIPENYSMTIMRRLMLRIAEQVAYRRRALAIATGESLGQVASQTLDSMNTINEVTNLPVLRPLVAIDKVDIITIAQEIDTYDISIRPYEDCCTIFLPAAPKTKPNRQHTNRFEAKLDLDALVEEAVNSIETIVIGEEQDSDIDALL